MRPVSLSILVLYGCVACGPSTPPPASADTKPTAAPATTAAPAAPTVEMAEAPYTVDQIRDGCPTGRKIVFKVEEDGKPIKKHVIEFIKSDAAGADLKSYDIDSSGKEVDAKTFHATWAELHTHAEFPKARAEIKHRTVSIPIGTLECTVYKVTGEKPDDEVVTYYFADKIPGPPVFYIVEKGGKRTVAQTMESNTGMK